MFRLFSATVILSVASAIVDLNCTSNLAYTATAVACSNTYSDAACDVLYPDSTVAERGTDERPSNCFNGTNGPSEDIKQIAIANCPKTCGYCCETTDYSCSNAQFGCRGKCLLVTDPRIQCSTITTRMCQDPLWRSVIASDCPAACGFCNLGGCIDAAPDCYLHPQVCVTIGLESFVATNCQRTCGLCSTSSTSSTSTTSSGSGSGSSGTSSSSCSNVNANCAVWAQNGFCSSTFYTSAQKKAYCPSSCGMC